MAPEPTLSIGSASGDAAYELYRVFGARKLSDGRIVLVNQGTEQIRFYDAAGRFLSQSGRAGGGPGEFSSPFHLWVLPGDTIWVGDYRPWQFHVFAPSGEWVRTVRPRPEYGNPPAIISVLDDGRSVLAERTASFGTGRQFETRTVTAVLHGADGALAERRRISDQYADVDTETRKRLVEPLISDDRPVADAFPAFASLMIGRDGRIWVKSFVRPLEASATVDWIAFGADGRFQCRTRLPAWDQVVELGADYVIGLDRDELGVEHVVEHHIGAPSR